MDFLVKPITKEDLTETIETAITLLRKNGERFEFQQGKEHFFIPQDIILYFESHGRKIRLTTQNETYEFYGKLKEIAHKLSKDFLPIHHSFIISKKHVQRYTYEWIEMENGDLLPISQNMRHKVRDLLLKGNISC